jgi:hypothetical protein
MTLPAATESERTPCARMLPRGIGSGAGEIEASVDSVTMAISRAAELGTSHFDVTGLISEIFESAEDGKISNEIEESL